MGNILLSCCDDSYVQKVTPHQTSSRYSVAQGPSCPFLLLRCVVWCVVLCCVRATVPLPLTRGAFLQVGHSRAQTRTSRMKRRYTAPLTRKPLNTQRAFPHVPLSLSLSVYGCVSCVAWPVAAEVSDISSRQRGGLSSGRIDQGQPGLHWLSPSERVVAKHVGDWNDALLDADGAR